MRRKPVLGNVWEETFSVVPVGKAPSVTILLPCTYILPHQTPMLISKYHPEAPRTSVINIRKLLVLSMTLPPTYKIALETMESFSLSLKSLMLLSTVSGLDSVPDSLLCNLSILARKQQAWSAASFQGSWLFKTTSQIAGYTY